MTIQDLAGNPLLTASSPMIGFIPAEVLEQPLSLRIYKFLLESIREEDQASGDQFIERFLQGPQAVWETNDSLIRSVTVLWSVTEIPDRFLQYLKNIVGWTIELRNVTDALDDLGLRRLIGASVPFWKSRGPEDAIVDILQLTTAKRLRIWNWFDFRIVIGEMAMGEEHQGFDPTMISLPGPPNLDENRFNIRLVDDGTLNHDLVLELVKLTRPSGERVEVTYIGFLDLFRVDDDDSQWTAEEEAFNLGGGQSSMIVANSVMTVTAPGTDPAESYVSVPDSEDWADLVVTWRLKGSEWRTTFYRTANTDMYFVSRSGNDVSLSKITAGAVTVLATVDVFATLGIVLHDDLFYAIRVEATPESGDTRIRVSLDAEQIISELDSDHVAGTIGVGHGASGNVQLDEVELFFNPLVTDTIDINS